MIKRQINLMTLAMIVLMSFFAAASHAGTISFSYDNMGRPIQAAYDDGTIIQFSYDKLGNRLQRTIQVAAGSCTYILSQTGQPFTSSGGSGSVTVTASSGCTWSASVHPSDGGWLGITPPAGATGSGQVNYSVSANTACQGRTGTMAIAGHTFTVTQTGSCTLTVSKTGAGSGTVSSMTPGIISCGTQCSTSLESGTPVILTAQPAAGSELRSWNGCDESVGAYCTLTMDAARAVTADFSLSGCANSLVATHPAQGSDSQYATLMAAYNDTYQVSLIKIQLSTLNENLQLSRVGTYTIRGGYDCAFQTSSMGTTVIGTAAVANGTVSMNYMILTGTTTIGGSGLLIADMLVLQ